MTFTIDGVAVGGPVPLDATGRATLVISSLAVGTHTVSADYSGSANYRPSTSGHVTQTVNKAASRTVVTTSGTPAPLGTTVVFTATVTAVAPGARAADRHVQFQIDGVLVGTPTALNREWPGRVRDQHPAGRPHTVSPYTAATATSTPAPVPGITQRIR